MKNTKEEIEIRKRVKEATYFENITLSEQIIAQTMEYIASGLLLGAGAFLYLEGTSDSTMFTDSYKYTKEAIDLMQRSMLVGGVVSTGVGTTLTILSIYRNKLRRSYISYLKNRKLKIEKEIRDIYCNEDIKELKKVNKELY